MLNSFIHAVAFSSPINSSPGHPQNSTFKMKRDDSQSESSSYASCDEKLDIEHTAMQELIEKTRKDHEEDIRLRKLEEEMFQKALQLSLQEQ